MVFGRILWFTPFSIILPTLLTHIHVTLIERKKGKKPEKEQPKKVTPFQENVIHRSKRINEQYM
jgi:hypothetical protein